MPYEIVVEDIAARPIAAVHVSIPIGGVATAWRPAPDKVWAFLRGQRPVACRHLVGDLRRSGR